MDRLALEKLFQWKDSNTLKTILKEVLSQEAWRKFSGTSRLRATERLHSWLEHPICKFITKTSLISLRLTVHSSRSERINEREFSLKDFLSGL